MSLQIGIVGLPNVGKSTLFNALTHQKVNVSNYPFCTIDPNVGVIPVPDERITRLATLVPGATVVPAAIEVVDVAGLIRGAHRGEGLGNQFLSHLLPMDALLFLIRCFSEATIPCPVEDPAEQLAVLREELLRKDEELALRARREKPPTPPPSLSAKPMLLVCNVRGDTICSSVPCAVTVDVKLERELAEMDPVEAKELGLSSNLFELIRASYQALDLITFYTIKGGKELRAWPVRQGATAPTAGGFVHSDFEKKFIRAEVIPYPKLMESGSWSQARERGWIRTEGQEYVVQDGDVMEFKI